MQQCALCLGFNFLLSCLRHYCCLLPKQTQESQHSCAVFLTSPTSQCLKWSTNPTSRFSPLFHTSGALGRTPSCGGGLCRCILQRPSTSCRQTTSTALHLQLSSTNCSSGAHICQLLESNPFHSAAGFLLGFLFLWIVRNGYDCTWSLSHCWMKRERLLLRTQIWLMVILHTFWPDD